MTEIRSFRDVIALWSSKEALASDVSVPAATVSKWWQRDSIPAQRWSAVLSTETAKTAGVTSDSLTRLAAREDVRT
jgi:DNA-binding transcriptional regulator YiaG